HAAATEALVQLMRNEDMLNIIIEDNGRGFDPSAAPAKGAGLGNVRSRVDYLHGAMDVRAEPGKRVCVHLECPLKYPLPLKISENNGFPHHLPRRRRNRRGIIPAFML